MRRADALSLARTLMSSGARVQDRPAPATVCETPRCQREATPPARLCARCLASLTPSEN